VAAVSLVISVCIALTYVLLARLTNWPVAFCSGCFLALDPFYISYGKLVHVDALLASFMLVSVQFLISYLQEKRRAHLVLSGVFAGMAFLTKTPSLFLIPYGAWVTLLYSLLGRWQVSTASSQTPAWSRWLLWGTRSLGEWVLVAVCVFFLAWPAMWTRPVEVLSEIAQAASFWVERPHSNPDFFAGRVVFGDPGPLYYMAALGWKTTLVTLPAILAAIFILLRRRKWEGRRGFPWCMLAYASGFILMMMFGAKKGPRYILPAFLALDVLAAWGLVQMASGIGRWDPLRQRTWIPVAVVSVALVAQMVTALRHHPYYGTHHNLLLGGSRVAQHVFALGGRGEGMELAARFLNGYPGVERMTAGLQHQGNEGFRGNFLGQVRSMEHPDVDYWIFEINRTQRKRGVDHWEHVWETCQQTESLWSVSFDGVPYVLIYRAYPYDPEAFEIDRKLDVQLGDHIRFLGYRSSSGTLSAGDALTVTLFWQSDGRLVEDYIVFVHLLNAEKSLAAQHDGVSVQGDRPTWSWRDAEVLRDEHVLVGDVGMPAGTYTLSVGMYDYLSGVRLPAVGPTGERLLEDRIVLREIRVASP
jgi:hypothetical protein